MPMPDFDFEPHYHDVSGLRMHYVDQGPQDAPVVVMVHGNPSWSFYYRRLVHTLQDRYRCIVPDHIGMGRSDKPGSAKYPHTLERRIGDLTHLLEEVVPGQPITLVMHDWGGMIGMGYAVSHVEQIRQLVVLNTAAFHLPTGKGIPLSLRLARTPGVGELLVQGMNMFCTGAAKHGMTRRRMAADVREAMLRPYDSWANRRAVLRFVQDIPLRPEDRGYELVSRIEAGLAEFASTPSFIGWGMRDFVFDEDFLDVWRAKLPHAELHLYEDAGHYILEDAWEDVNPLIAAFIDGQAKAALLPAVAPVLPAKPSLADLPPVRPDVKGGA